MPSISHGSLRRAPRWLAATTLAALIGCSDRGATQPHGLSAGGVRLSLAVQLASAGKTLEVSVTYRSGESSTVSLLDQMIDVGVDAHAVPLVVDIAPCLGDPQREKAGQSSTNPACVLHIVVTLLGASGEQLDQSVLPAMTVHAGDNAEASLAVGSRTSYVSLAPGLDHTCRALTVSGGGTTCWGSNRVGQLGRSPTPDFLHISAGLSYTCGLTLSGEVWCWGDNAAGQLGDNLSPSRATPALVKSPVAFTQLATGTDFACGLSTTGAAYCWGENAWATLGDGTKTRHAVPAPVKGGHTFRSLTTGGHFACGLTDGPVYCWGAIGLAIPSDALAALGPVPLGGQESAALASLTAGFTHACGLTVDGVALCAGTNGSGQLGDGTTIDRAAPVQVTGGLRFRTLTAGNNFTCGIATDGFAYCWGANGFGQLGTAATASGRPTPARVGGTLPFATLVAGQNHVCGSLNDGKTYCWGLNASGQLGDGTTANRSAPALVTR
jgi:alpha-tubulin suppressor-like RCC1 family protein